MDKYQIQAGIGVEEAEEFLDSLFAGAHSGVPPSQFDRTSVLQLATISGATILADVWAAILVGTLCRFRKPVTIRAWGLPNTIPPDAEFLRTLPTAASLQEATAVIADSGSSPGIDTASLRSRLALENGGLLEPKQTDSRTLIEFDPEYPLAPLLATPESGARESTRNIRAKLMHFVLTARRQLEIGARRRMQIPVSAGPAGNIAKFIAELHENGRTHGSRGIDSRGVRGVRFVRLRKHVAINKDALIKRCGSYRAVADYVRHSMPETSSPALIEASISDFGPGILDGFLSSTVSAGYKSESRRALLGRILHEQVSSKANDPGAGLGIPRALSAARQMGAFVSLRTGEHWLCAALSNSDHRERLRDVTETTHSYVAGTHWQLLWLQP